MSTCPDADLYSAYVDGEVPSPWKEKLQSHINSCQECKKRVTRYEVMKNAMTGRETPKGFLAPDRLESSFIALSSRRAAVLYAKNAKSEGKYRGWMKKTVRLSIPALAAIFAATFFIPAAIVATLKERANSGQIFASAIDTSDYSVLSSAQVYSPDSLPDSVTGKYRLAGNNRIFTMIDYARQFASDKDLFDGANIIIIKLPTITGINDPENIFNPEDTLQTAAGYFR